MWAQKQTKLDQNAGTFEIFRKSSYQQLLRNCQFEVWAIKELRVKGPTVATLPSTDINPADTRTSNINPFNL